MKKIRFLLVDDDPFNNKLCRLNIRIAASDCEVMDFTSPEDGLDYLQNTTTDAITLLLLDINMPTMTGWEFLQKYDQFDEVIKSNTRVYILSSSVDPRDKEKASANNHILEYLEKPLDISVIRRIHDNTL